MYLFGEQAAEIGEGLLGRGCYIQVPSRRRLGCLGGSMEVPGDMQRQKRACL